MDAIKARKVYTIIFLGWALIPVAYIFFSAETNYLAVLSWYISAALFPSISSKPASSDVKELYNLHKPEK